MGITEAQARILDENSARARGIELPKPKAKRPKYRSKTEEGYAAYLDLLQQQGKIREWRYESVTLLLAPMTAAQRAVRYTPDFVVRYWGGAVELQECKGRKGDTFWSLPVGKVKVRVAAAMFPWWTFCIVWPEANGEWRREVVR